MRTLQPNLFKYECDPGVIQKAGYVTHLGMFKGK